MSHNNSANEQPGPHLGPLGVLIRDKTREVLGVDGKQGDVTDPEIEQAWRGSTIHTAPLPEVGEAVAPPAWLPEVLGRPAVSAAQADEAARRAIVSAHPTVRGLPAMDYEAYLTQLLDGQSIADVAGRPQDKNT